jgi:hypothetical protein
LPVSETASFVGRFRVSDSKLQCQVQRQLGVLCRIQRQKPSAGSASGPRSGPSVHDHSPRSDCPIQFAAQHRLCAMFVIAESGRYPSQVQRQQGVLPGSGTARLIARLGDMQRGSMPDSEIAMFIARFRGLARFKATAAPGGSGKTSFRDSRVQGQQGSWKEQRGSFNLPNRDWKVPESSIRSAAPMPTVRFQSTYRGELNPFLSAIPNGNFRSARSNMLRSTCCARCSLTQNRDDIPARCIAGFRDSEVQCQTRR